MSNQSFIQQTRPVYYEGIIVTILGIIIIWNITATDISFHGNYVGFLIKQCHEKNTDPLCMQFREHLKVAPDAQMELGNAYWYELGRQAIFIGVTMFALRFAFAFLLHIAHVQKLRTSSWLMAILYGAVGYGLFMFGVLDTLYFVLQGQTVPESLDWLNHFGVFEFSRTFTGTNMNVESLDLYLTNLIGIGIIGILLLITMVFFKESNVHRGIA